MHELALMESLVATVRENVSDARVTRIRLRVGKLTCVLPDALRFCFEVSVQGTELEEAVLELVEVEGRGRCHGCGAELALALPVLGCPCGHAGVEVLAGEELRLDEVEVI